MRMIDVPPADRYAAWLPVPFGGFQEECAFPQRPALSELEIQARWFSGEFGRTFLTTAGDTVEVVQFGVWNRESGPDFRDAAVSLNGRPPVRGCIEIDPDARDWERHGHAPNPAYGNVLLHLFWSSGKPEFFTQTNAGRAVPQVRLDLSDIDRRTLFPVPYAKPGRCCAPLSVLPQENVAGLLRAAAHFRLRRKAHRLRQTAEVHGESAALYQAVAETLGYKSNKLPFLLLAQRLPPGPLRQRRAGLEALLFGVSGFLTDTDLAANPEGTRTYLREIWEYWWPSRSEFANLILPARLWKCGGVRPMNHPHRRVAALAELVRRWNKARAAFDCAEPAAVGRFFASLTHPFWDYHYTLTGRAAPRRMALVGPERVAGILVNVVLPWALRQKNAAYDKLHALPAPDFNLRVRIASLRLFGIEAKRVPMLKTAVHQQGLLQIYEDFCCQDASDCFRCKLPEQLRQWE